MQWETPPGPRKPGRRSRQEAAALYHDAVAAELRENPGCWGVVSEWPEASETDKAVGYALATSIRSGRIPSYRPAGSFEAVGRVMDDFAMKVYARYTG